MKVRNIIKRMQWNSGYGWGCPPTWYVMKLRKDPRADQTWWLYRDSPLDRKRRR